MLLNRHNQRNLYDNDNNCSFINSFIDVWKYNYIYENGAKVMNPFSNSLIFPHLNIPFGSRSFTFHTSLSFLHEPPDFFFFN